MAGLLEGSDRILASHCMGVAANQDWAAVVNRVDVVHMAQFSEGSI